MSHDYIALARKIKLLARPRLRVVGEPDCLRVELLRLPGDERALAAYEFTFKEDLQAVDATKTMKVMSAFLETAASMLEVRPVGQSAVIFSQNLYNSGFWMNREDGCSFMNCNIVALEYEMEAWDGAE